MSLTSHYRLNGNADDVFGKFDGIPTGIDWVTGKLGTCAGQPTTGSTWIDCGDLLDLPDNSPFSIAGWCYFDSLKNRDMLLCRNDAVQQTGPYTYLFGPRDNGTLLGAYDGGTWRDISYSFQTGQWYHLAFSYDGTTLNYYVNGVNIGSNAFSYSRNTAHNTQIGGYHPDGTSDIHGKVDDVRIYNHPLSDKEVYELAHAKTLHYKMDQDTDILRDSSGQGYDSYRDSSTGTHPVYSSGDRSYRFDGTNTIETDQIFTDDLNQEWTVNAWIYPENLNTADNQRLINFNNGAIISYGSGDKMLNYANSSVNDHYAYGPALSNNTWYFVTFRYKNTDGDTLCDIIVNGTSKYSSTNFDATDDPRGFAGTTVIGRDYIGLIRDLQVYASYISDQEIKQIYQERASIDNMGGLHANSISEDVNVLDFDGVDDYVETSDQFSALNDFTIEFWANVKNSAGEHSVFCGQAGADLLFYANTTYGSANDELRFYSGGSETLIGSSLLSKGYTHISITRSGQTYTLYYNGVFEVSGTSSDSISASNFTIGQADGYLGSREFEGVISEFRIWNIARTQTEIQNNMNTRLTGNETGLVAYYPLNEGAGTVATDKAGTNDGTLINGPTWSSGTPPPFSNMSVSETGISCGNISETGPVRGIVAWWPLEKDAEDYVNNNDGTVYGAVLSADGYEFDGTDDYIDTPFVYTYDSTYFSVAAWVTLQNNTSQHVVLNNYGGTSSYQHIICSISDTNTPRIFVDDGSTGEWIASTNTIPSDGNPHHIVWVYSDKVVTIYIDGVPDNAGTYSYSNPDLSERSMRIGARRNSTTNNNLDGTLRDIRFYQVALRSDEVNILYEMTDPANKKIKQTTDGVYLTGELIA